jgi:hypothetical protein
MKSILGILVLTFCGFSLTLGQRQVTESNSAFSKLPPAVKKDLYSRLRSYVEYRRTHRWTSLYDLLWKQYIAGPKGLNGMSKDQFVKTKIGISEAYEIIDFEAKRISLISNDNEGFVVRVEGCGKYLHKERRRHLRKTSWKSSLNAAFDSGHWYFTEIGIGPRCLGCAPEPCNLGLSNGSQSLTETNNSTTMTSHRKFSRNHWSY